MDSDTTAGAIESDAKAVTEAVPDDAISEWEEPVAVNGVKGTAAVPLTLVVAAHEREARPHALMKAPVLLKA